MIEQETKFFSTIENRHSKIKKVGFIYLIQEDGSDEYFISKEPGHSVQRQPQLGFQYMCAILKKKGIDTRIFDQTVSLFTLNQLLQELEGYDMVGFYCSDCQESIVKKYCQKIKEKLGIPILVGGPSTLTNPTFLGHGCDFVVHGEGELTIQHIIEYYNGVRTLDNLKGISYKKENQIIEATPQDLIINLDELPFPDRSQININSYYNYFIFEMKKPYITAIASRGCIYRCNYCTSCKLWSYKYRQRSVDNVLAEIDEVIDKYNVKYISFIDDVFGVSNNWVEEFCTKLIERPYKIRWMAILHPFSFRNDTEKILKLMRKSGCGTLSFGLQSANPEILKNINRHPDEPEQLKKILQIANELGFMTSVAYIFGLPGDTRKTIQDSIDYSVTCGSTVANFFVLSLLKGSELEMRYKNKKVCDLPENEILKMTISASRNFYIQPATIFSITKHILKNPAWIAQISVRLPSILSRIGFVKTKGKNR